MNFQKLIEFRYLRDVVITLTVRDLDYKIPQALEIKAGQNLAFISDQVNLLFIEYRNCRNTLFPDSDLLFPTEDGAQYMSSKFQQNIKKLLQQTGAQTHPHHPQKMHTEQLEAILALKFENQRPTFQQTLATAIMCFMALRPGEVASLCKNDIDSDSKIIYLRETKSQETQKVPIHPDLMPSLTAYLNHLKPNEPLFIRQSKKQWVRKDVYRAVENLGTHFGIDNIHPRRIRSTVACQMLRIGIPIMDVSALLRHKDITTTLRYYTGVSEIDTVRLALNEYRPTKPMPKLTHQAGA